MSIQTDLKKEGIEVIEQLDKLTTNEIIKNISRRIAETFSNYTFTSDYILEKLSKLKMYKAKMVEGMA